MKSKRILIAVFILALLVTALAHNTNRAPVAARQGATITIWATGSEDEAAALQAAGDLWGSQTGNTVAVEPVSWDDAHAKGLAAATSGVGPDIITGGLSWGIEFGELGGMVNLTEAYPDDIAAIAEASNEGIWRSIVSEDEQVFAVPFDLTLYLMYYRTDLVETPPQTWEELVAYIEASQDATGTPGFAMQWGNTQWLYFSNYLYQAGGDFYDEECNVTIDSEESVEALEFFASLYNDYGVSTEGWPDLEGGLNSGTYPLGVSGNWIVGGIEASYPDIAGKWAVAPLPAGPSGSRTAFIGGRVMGVMSFSPSQDAAFDFIKFLYTEEGARAVIDAAQTRNITWIPPQTEFQQFIAYPAAIEAIEAQLAEAKGPPNCYGWEAAANEVQAQIQSVIFDGADAQDALDEAAGAMEDLRP